MLKSVRGRFRKTLSSSGPSLLQMMTTSRLTMTPDAPTTPKRNSRRQLCAWRTKTKCRRRSMIERAYRPSPVGRRVLLARDEDSGALGTGGRVRRGEAEDERSPERADFSVCVQPGRLTSRTSVGGAVHERLPGDSRATTKAGLTLPAVHRQCPIEVSARPVDVHVQGVEGRPTLAQRRVHDLRCGLQQL